MAADLKLILEKFRFLASAPAAPVNTLPAACSPATPPCRRHPLQLPPFWQLRHQKARPRPDPGPGQHAVRLGRCGEFMACAGAARTPSTRRQAVWHNCGSLAGRIHQRWSPCACRCSRSLPRTARWSFSTTPWLVCPVSWARFHSSALQWLLAAVACCRRRLTQPAIFQSNASVSIRISSPARSISLYIRV